MRSAACGVAVAAALAVLLTSCGGGSPRAKGPSPLPITASSAGTASAGTPTPTLDPNSDAAVIDAAYKYVAAFQVAARTGDPSEFFAITLNSCACRVGAQRLVDQLSATHHHTNATLTANNIEVKSRKGGRAELTFTISNAPYQVLDEANGVVGDAPAARQAVDVSFELQGQRWIAYLSA